MIWDRLGVLTDEVSPNLDTALDWVVQQGLKHVEIRTLDGINVMDLEDAAIVLIRSAIEERGLFVSALASPVFKCTLDSDHPVTIGDTFGQQEESVEAHFGKLVRAIEIAKGLGTPYIRIFSFWRERIPLLLEEEIVGYLKRAAAIAEQEEIILLLENEPACNGGFAAEIGRMITLTSSPALKALWDPGNEAYGGKSAYPEGYSHISSVLGHVHLKDAIIGEDGIPHCVPIGSGTVHFADQIAALEREGYQGLYTIETHYIPPGGTAADGTLQSLEGLRQVLESFQVMNRVRDTFAEQQLTVHRYSNRLEMGRAVAADVAETIRRQLQHKERLTIVFASAPSQNEFLEALVERADIEWERLVCFHLDEYVGLPADAPQSFSRYLQDKLFTKRPPQQFHRINGLNEPETECIRYGKLLETYGIDIACIGIGENGHLAFNDPHVADFHDLYPVKLVSLDETSRKQQVNDGCFTQLNQVPVQAITLTIPVILSAAAIFCTVPGARKSSAVGKTLLGPVTTLCPSSILRTARSCQMYLDMESASELVTPGQRFGSRIL